MPSSDPRAAAGRFLAVFAIAAIALALALLGLTWATDPTGLLRAAGLSPGLCTPGIRAGNERHAKALLASVLQPEEVILGSSRALRGFGPAALPAERSVNLGMSGATFSEVDSLARQAAEQASVQRLWIGLDFGAFIDREGHREPLVFPAPGSDRRWTALRHGLLDARALRASLVGLFAPGDCANPPFTGSGFIAAGASANRLPAAADRRPLATIARAWALAAPDRDRTYAERLRRLDNLLGELQRRRKRVVIFLGPASTAYRTAVAGAGLESAYRRWRSDAEATARRHGATFVAGDEQAFLSEVARRTCGVRATADCLFSDAVHYRAEVGAAIVQAALEAEPVNRP